MNSSGSSPPQYVVAEVAHVPVGQGIIWQDWSVAVDRRSLLRLMMKTSRRVVLNRNILLLQHNIHVFAVSET